MSLRQIGETRELAKDALRKMLARELLQEMLVVVGQAEDEFRVEQQRLLCAASSAAQIPRKPLANASTLESVYSALGEVQEFHHTADYVPTSKLFVPIETNLSFVAVGNVSSLFSYNSIDLSGMKEYRTDYVEMLNRLSASIRGSFVDQVTRRKLRTVIAALQSAFPLVQKVPLVLHFLTGIELEVLLRLFFECARTALQPERPRPANFFAFATSFCKVCKLYLCDYHYPSEVIKNFHVKSPDNALVEKVYFLDRVDAGGLRRLAAARPGPAEPLPEGVEEKHCHAAILARSLGAQGLRLPSIVYFLAEEPSLRAEKVQPLRFTAPALDPAAYFLDKSYQFISREVKRESFLCQIDTEFEQLRRGCSCLTNCPKPESGKKAAAICSCLLQAGRECLPNVCRCSCAHNPALRPFLPAGANLCANANFAFRVQRRLRIRRSRVCLGFGLFTEERLQRGDFIGYYIGEFLTKREESLQDAFSKLLDASYLFTIKTSQFGIIDAYNYGNATRFINHMPSSVANAEVKEIASGGARVICFFASRAIPAGSEVYFDYGKEYILKWKMEFDAKIARYVKERKTRKDKLRQSKFLQKEKSFFNAILN